MSSSDLTVVVMTRDRVDLLEKAGPTPTDIGNSPSIPNKIISEGYGFYCNGTRTATEHNVLSFL